MQVVIKKRKKELFLATLTVIHRLCLEPMGGYPKLFFFFWYWDLNSGPCACEEGCGTTELNPRPYPEHSIGCEFNINIVNWRFSF